MGGLGTGMMTLSNLGYMLLLICCLALGGLVVCDLLTYNLLGLAGWLEYILQKPRGHHHDTQRTDHTEAL